MPGTSKRLDLELLAVVDLFELGFERALLRTVREQEPLCARLLVRLVRFGRGEVSAQPALARRASCPHRNLPLPESSA